MKNSTFLNDNRIRDWLDAAKRLKEQFGLKNALGYLIGEKFYEVVKMIYFAWDVMSKVEAEREKKDYSPIRITGNGINQRKINLDKVYDEEKNKIPEVRKALDEFAEKIKEAFSQNEIEEYFNSHPRLGKIGNILTEEEHKVWVNKKAVEHSIDTEVQDAKIFGDMMKYLLTTNMKLLQMP